MSSSSASAQTILYVAHVYSIYVFTTVFITGLVGNLCNIVIFISLEQFRHFPGAFYITVESIANCALLLVGLMSRIVNETFGSDPSYTLLIWCKLRNPATQWCTLIGLSAINFAAFDQYLSTNCVSRFRQLSTTKLAKYLIGVALIIWLLYQIPFVIFSNIQATVGCILTSVELLRYYSFFHLLVLNGLLPVFLTTTFSILAYRNVRRIRRQQMNNIRRRLDHQLTAMILARVTFLVLCLLPFIIQRFYMANAHTDPKDVLRIAIEKLVGAINIVLSYLNVSVCLFVC
ncbi:unnamed protein product [Rotaria sp. Silwood1]|nr:unnamed protein product [Rotaria sp. Silwood1]CAF5096633.1 unnamed protein product [Rotaria sp. Silwood1]